jgi:hypothetical protein
MGKAYSDDLRERENLPSKWLHLDWKESGVEVPPSGGTPLSGRPRTGRGRDLIEQTLPYQFGAQTTFSLRNPMASIAPLRSRYLNADRARTMKDLHPRNTSFRPLQVLTKQLKPIDS